MQKCSQMDRMSRMKERMQKKCNFFKKTSWPLLFLLSSMHHAGKKMRGCIKRVPHVTYYFTFIFPGSHLAPCHHHVTHTHQHLPSQMSKHRKKFIPPCLTLPSPKPACLWELRNRKGTESSLCRRSPPKTLPPLFPVQTRVAPVVCWRLTAQSFPHPKSNPRPHLIIIPGTPSNPPPKPPDDHLQD